jgi:hypothetical protein
MRKQPLWFWGFLCIFAGVASRFVGEVVQGPPRNRPEMMGRAVAQLLFIGIGVVLIIVHFVRRK